MESNNKIFTETIGTSSIAKTMRSQRKEILKRTEL